MWMLFLFIRILCITCVCAYEHEDYSPGYSPGKEEPEVGVVEDLIQGVSSLDELLELLYPAYSLVQQCLRRKAVSTTPHHYTDDPMWGSSRQAALFKSDGTLEVIMEEIQRTKCSPREVCLEVAKEFPESTSRFYVPRCVSAHRCGGCCNSEAWQCTNTSYTVMNKTLLEISPQKSVVMVPVVNHTSCECQQKRPKHSIIRRSVDLLPTLCPQPDEPCDAGLVWDELACECIPVLSLLLDQQLEPRDSALLELCGPNKVLDEESCECACQNGLTDASCEPGWRLDEGSCECVCEVEASGAQPDCPPNQSWDPELCACVCLTQCPPSQPLDPEMCQCQCRESEQTCLLQGKRFKADSCSCYRLPCKDPHKKCQMGYYYSHFVCQCIPNFMRPPSERELT